MKEPTAGHSRGALARRFYETLVSLQFEPAQSLAAFQDNVLRDLIAHVTSHSRFYRQRLTAIIDDAGKIDLARWREIPILTAAEVTAHYDELRATSLPKAHGRIFRYQSSETTDRSLAYYRSELADLAQTCGQFRHFHTMGIDWRKDLALIRAFDPALGRFREPRSAGTHQKEIWGPNWIDPGEVGAIHALSVFASVQAQVDWLNGLGEIYLNTFPSNAMALARHVRKSGASKPKVLAVLTAGEPMTADVRHEVETGLGCPCFDIISNAEFGMIACECPSQQGYHLQSELVRIELLDEHDRPIAEGQWGRVVATPLYNFAMPLIRYDTGDWARLKGLCRCGRHHPLIDITYGRPSSLLRSEKSGWMRPQLASEEMDKYLPGCRWQLTQVAPHHVELRYMRYPASEPVNGTGAKTYVESLLEPGISVSVRETAALGPNAGGKFPAFISRLG